MRTKVDEFSEDEDFLETARKYQDEAANNAINAFCEGFMLGQQHARKVFGIKGEDED